MKIKMLENELILEIEEEKLLFKNEIDHKKIISIITNPSNIKNNIIEIEENECEEIKFIKEYFELAKQKIDELSKED